MPLRHSALLIIVCEAVHHNHRGRISMIFMMVLLRYITVSSSLSSGMSSVLCSSAAAASALEGLYYIFAAIKSRKLVLKTLIKLEHTSLKSTLIFYSIFTLPS